MDVLKLLNTLDAPLGPLPAPDGSTIFELLKADAASLVLCELAPGACSQAVRHRTIAEIWHVLAGSGELWRAYADGTEETVSLLEGKSVRIPTGAAFQFRNPGAAPLRLFIVTMPPWPGADEVVPANGHWPSAQL